MNSYHCFKEELPKELCKGLATIGKELDKEEAKVFKEGSDVDMKEVRNNRVAWLENPELTSILQLYVEKANIDAGWNFNINCFETPQVSFYGKGQFYDWHMDTGVETSADPFVRKLSLSLTLDDDFKGGDFQVQDWVHPQASK